MKKTKWAIIDDIRELNCDFIAKDARAGIKMMTDHFDEIGTLCMDHDLGDAEEMNGYEVLKFLMLKGLVPDHVQMVTSNPVGRTNMANLLIAEGYETVDGINFLRKNK